MAGSAQKDNDELEKKTLSGCTILWRGGQDDERGQHRPGKDLALSVQLGLRKMRRSAFSRLIRGRTTAL